MGTIKTDGVGLSAIRNAATLCAFISKLKNKKSEEIIEDIKFETLGCGAAIATSSVATDMAKGKTLDEALKITNEMVADELGGLPAIKMHCSNLAANALKKAIEGYRKGNSDKK